MGCGGPELAPGRGSVLVVGHLCLGDCHYVGGAGWVLVAALLWCDGLHLVDVVTAQVELVAGFPFTACSRAQMFEGDPAPIDGNTMRLAAPADRLVGDAPCL